MQIPQEWSHKQRSCITPFVASSGVTSTVCTTERGASHFLSSSTSETAHNLQRATKGNKIRKNTRGVQKPANEKDAVQNQPGDNHLEDIHDGVTYDQNLAQNTSAKMSSRHGTEKVPNLLSKQDIQEFAADVATRNVALNTQFIRSVGNDKRSIGERIMSILPHHHDESVAKKRKHLDHDDSLVETGEIWHSHDSLQQEEQQPRRCDMKLELDTLLSRLPYKQMMQDILPSNTERAMASVPLVTRVYEESYMREPMRTGERLCVMGTECECMFINPNNAFVGVEFVIPDEDLDTQTPQMCVLCSRACTQQLFYDVVFDNTTFQGTIQRFGNMHSIPNEYMKESMLICPPNGPIHAMPLPIVSHQRNRYTVVKLGGVKYIRQHGVFFQ